MTNDDDNYDDLRANMKAGAGFDDDDTDQDYNDDDYGVDGVDGVDAVTMVLMVSMGCPWC